MITKDKRERIIKKVKDYQQCLGLGHWELNILFSPIKVKGIKGIVAGQCDCNSRYLLADITFNSKLDNIHDETIIHELCHCILAEMQGYCESNGLKDNWTQYFNERATSHISNMFVKIIKSKLK